MSPVRAVLAASVLLATTALPVRAQRLGSVSGTIRVARSGPVLEGARITLVGTTLLSVSNAKGEFAFVGLVPGRYTIQSTAIGYNTLRGDIEIRPLENLEVSFEHEPEGVKLPDIAVEERANLPADFARRRESGQGRYFSRADIAKRNPASIGDLLRMVPGLRVECRGMVCRVRALRASRNCNPAFFMDGIPTDPSAVWLTPPTDLEGIEIYAGPSQTPPELERDAGCGAIVFWTRGPPPRRPKEKAPAPPDTASAGLRAR